MYYTLSRPAWMNLDIMKAAEPSVAVRARGEDRLRSGHPWIYKSDLADVRATGGEVVTLVGPRGRRLGHALYSDRSEIALRIVDTDTGPLDQDIWRRRLWAAIAYRETLRIDASSYRLVHGEADLLPSLVVDRYGDYLVVQALSQGMDRLQSAICEILTELVRPLGILARNDSRVRRFEGLALATDVVAGTVPDSLVITEAGIEYEVDLRAGQKTGFFLDQRENRQTAAGYGQGRALDCFSYTGGFALQLARRCAEVVALEISEEAVARCLTNAARNGLTNVQARIVNVFDALRELDRAGERFDIIVLDPPAFAKTRSALPKALGGYKEINLRALKLLSPGGCLVSCTCSYHVDEATFGQVIHEAALDARARVVVVEKRTQARDHPVLLGVPETSYLKCFILRKLP